MQGVFESQAAPRPTGAAHLLFAQTSPESQPSSTVQLPFAGCRTAHVPHVEVLLFSQWVLMHCQLEPQDPPLTTVPALT